MAVFQKLCPSVTRVLSNVKFLVTVKLNLYSQNSYCEASLKFCDQALWLTNKKGKTKSK